jgi:hypothetical protein
MEFLQHSLRIKPPDALKKDPGSCLVVCSMYADQIVERLGEMNYGNPVIKLHPKIIFYRKVSRI